MSADDGSSAGSKTPMPLNDNDTSYFNNISPSSKSTGLDIPSPMTPRIRERRSSISLGLDTLRHAGGANSIDNFARSWTRAAGYFEITPARQSYVSVSTRDEEDRGEHEHAVYDDTDDEDQTLSEHAPLQPTLSNGGYGTYGSYNSFGSMGGAGMPTARLNSSVVRHAADLFAEQQQAQAAPPIDKEREPLLVKTVEREDGVVEQVIIGQSTLPQTVFNSVNVLIGVGLLSLPLGLKYSGWLFGMAFLIYCAIITNYTAKLLSKCLERSPNKALVTYSDIAYIAFGHKSRIFVSILFSLELIAACVALVVLFGDSLHDLIPSISVVQWKIIASVVLTPLSFLPLRVLSFSSILGILSTFSIFVIVVINGCLKPDAPGSLRQPMETYLFPQSWLTLPLSIGVLMSPWGGHSVFPNIFKDMRHPHKYNKAVDMTYIFTYLLDAGMAVCGILMFGDGVKDELTSSILEMTSYPEGLRVAMVVFIAIIPLTKIPLNARPIISTLEVVMSIDPASITRNQGLGMSGFFRGLLKFTTRLLVNLTFVILAILFPGFDRIMAFMGSALCFSICVILPIMFYLKIFGQEVGKRERILDWFLIISSSILAIIGTIFTFIPNEKLGA
ncbi:transmembrane amino acid transporter protein-domain-containing protein [Geopyxis carbonaria]|nr:transmembrane amino acid transporter protein-domain-containing protein [Geopyxis carbonaria]